MESRKFQLQNQIIEALKANDQDLYSLLKTQWAHRFGVESLEELKDLDLNLITQNPTDKDNQKIDQSKDIVYEDDKLISRKEDDIQDKEILDENHKVIESDNMENKESFQNKSYEKFEKENYQTKIINPVKEYKKAPEVKALIPLPPKPKYGYLKKWL